jgi:hypothetical protein
MTAILKYKHKIRSAKDFLQNFEGHPVVPPATEGQHSDDRNHYVFIGRTQAWETDLTADPPVSEYLPPAPQDSVSEEYRTWDSIISFKKATESDVALVIPRFDWKANTIYAAYDDQDPILFEHPTEDDVIDAGNQGFDAGPLVIITDEFHVFKCLDNAGGAASTEKPTLPTGSPYTVTTADGYTWKFIYTIAPEDVPKFVTDKWIPVDEDADVVADAGTRVGSVDKITVQNPGSEYIYFQTDEVLAGAGASTAILSAAASTDLNAYVGCTIYIKSGTTVLEKRVITAYNNVTKEVTVDSSWAIAGTEEYDILPTVNVVGNGTGLEAKAIVDEVNSEISEIVVTDGGSGYTYAEATLESSLGSNGLSGTGTHATIAAVLSPISGHGGDPVNELGAFFVLINVQFDYNESEDFPTSNDYRQIGVIRDLLDFNGTLAISDTLSSLKKLTLSGYTSGIGGEFQPDEVINGSDGSNTAQARIVQFNDLGSGVAEIYYEQDSETGFDEFLAAMTITGATTASTGTVDTITDEEVEKYSGDMIYIDNRRSILRAENQIEDIKIIMEF